MLENWEVALIAILAVILSIILLLGVVKAFTIITKGHYEVTEDQTGKVFLITGANTGIGKETALALAAKNARVIIGCRNTVKGESAVTGIKKQTGNDNIVCKKLDLCSFESVREFAEDIIKNEPRLDVLINNAGTNTPPKLEFTADGYETTLQSNHLGHFLLTYLLLDLLKKSAPSRIVVLGSDAMWFGSGNPHDLNMKPALIPFVVYSRTKTFNMLFTVHLAKLLEGTGVTVNCCHPGAVYSDFLRDQGDTKFRFSRMMVRMFGKSPQEGAMTSLYAATSPELAKVSGKFLRDCKQSRQIPSWACNKDRAAALWESSLKAVGLASTQDENSTTARSTTRATT